MGEQGRLDETSSGRPGWDEYFLGLVDQVASRATCNRGRCGCVIARDRRIVSTGYVGAPPGVPHCDEVGHLFKTIIDDDGVARQHCARTIHAEQNAITQAARYGVALEGATIYCSMTPCRVCAMLIISTGLQRVVARRHYHADRESRELLEQAGIGLEVLEDSVVRYQDQEPSPRQDLV